MKNFFKKIWEGWKKVAHAMGVFMTKVLLTIFYIIAMGISNLILRIARKDLLDRKFESGRSLWHARELTPVDLETAKRQF